MDKEIGKYLIDVSKLIFGGVVLAGVWKIEEFEQSKLLFFGIGASLVLALSGFIFMANALKKEKKIKKKK
jgi:hypothetical protein